MGKQKDKSSEQAADDANTSQGDREDKESLYNEKLKFVSVISKPMATRKQAKKLYKLIKKASKQKKFLRCGLKDVQKQIRNGEKGIVVFAGNVSPLDIICHLPAVCEEKQLPYIFTPSREDLGTAVGRQRAVLLVLIKEHEEYKDLYDECYTEIEQVPLPI